MKLLEGLDNLNRPAFCWALSDHMIFWFIIWPVLSFVFIIVLPVLVTGLFCGVWSDDYDY